MGLADFVPTRRNDIKRFPGPGSYPLFHYSDFGNKKRPIATMKFRHPQKIGECTTGEIGPTSYNVQHPDSFGERDVNGVPKSGFTFSSPQRGEQKGGAEGVLMAPTSSRSKSMTNQTGPGAIYDQSQLDMARFLPEQVKMMHPSKVRGFTFGSRTLMADELKGSRRNRDGSNQAAVAPFRVLPSTLKLSKFIAPLVGNGKQVYTMGVRRTDQNGQDGPGPAGSADGYGVPTRLFDSPRRHAASKKAAETKALTARSTVVRCQSDSVSEPAHCPRPPGPLTYVNTDPNSIAARTAPRHNEGGNDGGFRTNSVGGAKVLVAAPRNRLPGRHSTKQESIGPGPAAYTMPSDFDPKTSIRKGRSVLSKYYSEDELDKIYPTPAPGDYRIPSQFDEPALTSGHLGKTHHSYMKGWTMAGRWRDSSGGDGAAGDRPQDPLHSAHNVRYRTGGMAEESRNPHWYGGRGFRFNADKTFEDGVKRTTARQEGARGEDGVDDARDGPRRQRWERRKKEIYAEQAKHPMPPDHMLSGRRNAPKVSMCFKLKQNEGRNEFNPPGPGTYDTYKHETFSQNAKGTDFAHAAFRLPQQDEGPGPLTYDSDISFHNMHPSRATSMYGKGLTVFYDSDDDKKRSLSSTDLDPHPKQTRRHQQQLQLGEFELHERIKQIS